MIIPKDYIMQFNRIINNISNLLGNKFNVKQVLILQIGKCVKKQMLVIYIVQYLNLIIKVKEII